MLRLSQKLSSTMTRHSVLRYLIGPVWVALSFFVTRELLAQSLASQSEKNPADQTSQSTTLDASRAEAWHELLSRLSPDQDESVFLRDWHPAQKTFSVDPNFDDPQPMHFKGMQSGEAETIILTHYNEVAYKHIRDRKLYSGSELDHLRRFGAVSSDAPRNRHIPAFPSEASVVLTAWWPVSATGITPMPVWDPERTTPLIHGNGYATWQRVVGVDSGGGLKSESLNIEFLGRKFSHARPVELERFRHIQVSQEMADTLMRDPLRRKAAIIALGRPLAMGDHLALVAIHLAVKRSPGWLWATFWWHDSPNHGPYAASRPDEMPSPWRNYLLDVAGDASVPVATDGGPRVSFNPWLEARFPDGGHGGGTVSNCIACHSRASYPPVPFLPIRRGNADLANDPAYGPDRLRTDFIWSIARPDGRMQSVPQSQP